MARFGDPGIFQISNTARNGHINDKRRGGSPGSTQLSLGTKAGKLGTTSLPKNPESYDALAYYVSVRSGC